MENLELFEKSDLVKKEPATVQARFMEEFKKSYELVVGQPYEFKKEQFIIAARLIKAHGYAAVVVKTRVLGVLCKTRRAWFTRDGWSDFSIGTLSRWWNSILPEMIEDPKVRKDREFLDKLKKNKEARAHV